MKSPQVAVSTLALAHSITLDSSVWENTKFNFYYCQPNDDDDLAEHGQS